MNKKRIQGIANYLLISSHLSDIEDCYKKPSTYKIEAYNNCNKIVYDMELNNIRVINQGIFTFNNMMFTYAILCEFCNNYFLVYITQYGAYLYHYNLNNMRHISLGRIIYDIQHYKDWSL